MRNAPRNQTHRIDELLGSVTEELLLGNPQQFEDHTLRVERLLLEMVRPDPVQPRRVLPEQLHFAFHGNRSTPTQALKELVQLVQVAARQRGRPFNNVLELLPNPDDESDEEQVVHLSPEEQLLHDLVNLAITIRDDGQVNPLTVVDISRGVTQQFRIETGERCCEPLLMLCKSCRFGCIMLVNNISLSPPWMVNWLLVSHQF